MFSLVVSFVLAAATGQQDAVAPEDRSGRSRQARCKIDGGHLQKCRFTPLFGDGSFNIELADGNEYRLVVRGDDASGFVVMGPEKRIRLWWQYHRSKQDRACWVTDEKLGSPQSICAY